jgi:transcriptional regulator with XRE-family HTH domain
MNIGERIRYIRNAKQLSQKEVALLLEMDQSQYSKIELGKTDPAFSTVEKVALALGISLAELMSEQQPLDVNTFDKTLVEKVKLIDELDEKQKNSIFTFIDTALTNKRLKDSLKNTLQLVD